MRKIFLGLVALAGAALIAPTPSGAREIVRFRGYDAGTIVVKTGQRRLYYVLGDGKAIRYPVGVGRAGMQWSGTAYIDGKYIKPAWQAPDSIRKDYRRYPLVIPSGSRANPMGAAAMTLSGGGQYAIHGTNAPGYDRPFRLARLHPHVQQRHHGPLPPCRLWHARGRDPLTGADKSR